jgi:hypothetical protein
MVIDGVPWNVHSFSPWNVQNSRYPTIDHLTFPSLWHPWYPHSAPRLWKWPQQWSDPISDDIANFTRPSVSQSFSPWNQMKSTNLKYISHDFPWWIVSKSSQNRLKFPSGASLRGRDVVLTPGCTACSFPQMTNVGQKKVSQSSSLPSFHITSPCFPQTCPHGIHMYPRYPPFLVKPTPLSLGNGDALHQYQWKRKRLRFLFWG